tara:strand:+ start:9612 stop:10289 length:678 start_codon:yes stop_codon:yes gene_type:complete
MQLDGLPLRLREGAGSSNAAILVRNHEIQIGLFGPDRLLSRSCEPGTGSQNGVIDYKKAQQAYFRTHLEKASLQELKDAEAKKLVEPVAKIQELSESQRSAQQMLDDPTLSDEKKRETAGEARKRSVELVEIQTETEKLRHQSNLELAARIAKVQAEIVGEIDVAIEEVAKLKNLAIVQNLSFRSSGVSSVPYVSADLTIDITDEVIATLNEGAPADWKPETGEQ